MNQEMRILRTSISEVFEKMFFLYLESADRVVGSSGLKASIEFRGPHDGAVELYFSLELLTVMAQNMLSLPAHDVGDSERDDCAREAANMVCGNFLAILDPSRRYELTIPTCVVVDTIAAMIPEDVRRLDFVLDGKAWVMTAVLSKGSDQP